MSTKPCEFCGGPAVQVVGRRPRKYCSDVCRQKAWQSKKKNLIPEYELWISMKQRCENPKNKNYKYYGGRGIKVCDRWKGKSGFKHFTEDVGPRPSKNHTLDRFPDKNGNYEPTNVRWATKKEQGGNTRKNTWLEFNGEKKILSEWARYYGVTNTFICRLLQKKTPDEVFAYCEQIRLTGGKPAQTKKIKPEKMKRPIGRPPGSGKKKEVDGKIYETENGGISSPIMDRLLAKITPEMQHETNIKMGAEKAVYDQSKQIIPPNDEPAKYQTAPMSNWAIENRKRKLGLKD